MPSPPGPDAAETAALAEAARLQRQGRVDAAIGHLQAFVARQPRAPRALKALAALSLHAGQASAAVEAMLAARALEPGSVPLAFETGCLLAHVGRHPEALALFRDCTRREPGFVDGWYFLGITLARVAPGAEALAALRRAHALDPGSLRNLQALAQQEFSIGFPADALPLWQALGERRPDDEDTVLKLGETLGRVGRHDDARDLFARGVARRPDAAPWWMALAQVEEDRGDRDAAEAAYRQALALRPDWAFPLAGLLGLRRGQADPDLVDQAAALQASERLSDGDRALLGYELGKVLDARGDYRRAMASWDDANAARRRVAGEFDLARLEGRVERMLAVFDHRLFEDARGTGVADERPVFVVGMPRSGTTLTEQILGAHPQAMACGELPDLPLIARALSRTGAAQAWPHIPEDVDPADLPAAASRYLAAASRQAPAGARRLVDKAPMNYYLLGLAALMFPHARIVWCRRDARDVALSIYGENFALEEPFATRLDAIGHAIRLQRRIMRHWQAVLPQPILALDYEALVADPEAQARRLVAFLDLPWDPSCLQFHARDVGVQTPSRWQVKQPVHTRSVARWRHYEFAMAPLLEALGGDPSPGG